MTRPQCWIFTGGFLALIYAVPFIQAGLEMSGGRAPRFLGLFSQIPTQAHLRAQERQLEDLSVVAKSVRPWMQRTAFSLLGDAGEKVITGKQGWLFYKPDVRFLVEPAQAGMRESFAAITDFRDQLARRDIKLLLLPVPGKPTVYPEKLTSRLGSGDRVRSPAEDLMVRLQRAGVESVDLYGLFAGARNVTREPLYLLRDTHWSPAAARQAAETVAAKLESLGWIRPESTEYAVREVTLTRASDITQMMRIPNMNRLLAPETLRSEQVVRHDSSELYRDDASSSVLVLGDSFLRIYQTDEPRGAGFIAHLARALRMPLASVVNDGGASTLVRQELARRPELLRGKKVLIWEFVERDIHFGAEGWKSVRLPD